MKHFEEPMIEVKEFVVEDVITASGDTEIDNGGEWN